MKITIENEVKEEDAFIKTVVTIDESDNIKTEHSFTSMKYNDQNERLQKTIKVIFDEIKKLQS